MKNIRNLPDFDKPREKLAAKGPEFLSDEELLAVIIGKGIKGRNVFEVAYSILRKIEKDKKPISMDVLMSINGIGQANACKIMAAFEFARRRLAKKTIIVENAVDVLPLISDIISKKQECFKCITLNGAHEVIENRIVTMGLLNSNLIHPREVFADAISDRAASIILAHNHPSGSLKPSDSDLEVTKQLIDTGKIIGIEVMDHIIITNNGYASIKSLGFF